MTIQIFKHSFQKELALRVKVLSKPRPCLLFASVFLHFILIIVCARECSFHGSKRMGAANINHPTFFSKWNVCLLWNERDKNEYIRYTSWWRTCFITFKKCVVLLYHIFHTLYVCCSRPQTQPPKWKSLFNN